ALRRLERARDRAQGLFDGALAAAERAAAETDETSAALSAAARSLEVDPGALEKAEERLFELRALARKHNVQVADLPRVRHALTERLAAIDAGTADLARLGEAVTEVRNAYVTAADAVSQAREAAAKRLDVSLAAE